MKRTIEGWNRRQSFLFPECVDDYVDENNPVQAIEAFVDEMDLAELGFGRTVPSETIRPGCHPACQPPTSAFPHGMHHTRQFG